MLTKPERTIIFLGDLMPIFLIAVLQTLLPFKLYEFLTLFSTLVLSVIGILYWDYIIKKSRRFLPDGRTFKISKVEDKGSVYIIYMITFVSLIPLFNHGLFGLISFMIIILIVYSLYMNSDMLFYNPILGLFNYKFYKMELEDETEIYILSRSSVKKNQEIRVYGLTDYTYLLADSGNSSESLT